MKKSHVASMIIAVAGLFCAPEFLLAQNAPSAPLRTIGTPSNAAARIVPSLIVFNSRGATLQGDKLTLTGVSPNAIVFADRPVRAAGHQLTADLLGEWKSGDSFDKDPPNATVSALSKDAATNIDAVVVLKSPKLEGDKLTFDVQVLEGNLNGADGPAAVFIDIIGRPLTPLSFAGAARRTAFRGAWYGGAAVAGAAVAGAAAAAYYHPYGYYPPPPPAPACGYYPYPPCY